MSGTLVAVVGPSGAGKDSVIGFARERFAADPRIVFPQRVITRPAGPDEDNLSVTPARFAELDSLGEFALAWNAHGLRYGVLAEVAEQVGSGKVAVVNVSRSVLPQLAQRFTRSDVVRVSASESIRRERLARRGREQQQAVEARVVRPDPVPDFDADLEIVNDGPLATAGDRLVEFVADLARTCAGNLRPTV